MYKRCEKEKERERERRRKKEKESKSHTFAIINGRELRAKHRLIEASRNNIFLDNDNCAGKRNIAVASVELPRTIESICQAAVHAHHGERWLDNTAIRK